MNRKLIKKSGLIVSFFLFILCFQTFCIFQQNSALEPKRREIIHQSGEEIHTEEWMNNNDFSTQDEWFFTKGDKGDNSTIDGNISGGDVNVKILGDNQNIEISDPLNDGTWYKYRNDVFLFPDTSIINEDGCYVSHDYDENVNQTRNYHSVHWRKNVTLGYNMSDYIITTASLKAIFNATVNINVDTSNDNFPVQFGIGDFATFYVLISDVNLTNPYRIANNRTTNLGQDSPSILSIPDKEIETVEEDDIITALTSSIEKDPDYTTFTITLGIDIYCEDNGPPSLDHDTWEELLIKSCNLTFTIERKMEKFTSMSVNQIGNTISGADIQITDANLKFNYSIDQKWPTSLSPFSEIRILINDNLHPETIRLSTANLTFEEAKVGGFDLTHLILKDVNITLSIQVYIANTFGLDSNYTISIDDVYLSITYVKIVPDITTAYDLFLNNENKTLDPLIVLPYGVDLNITIKYLEYLTRSHISNATVQLMGKVSGFLNESVAFNQYSIAINTSKLGLGVKTLTIVAQKNLYETQNFQFFVEVIERDTKLELYLDNVPKNDSTTIEMTIDDFVNVTVYYNDSATNNHIPGANVYIEGLGELNETIDRYTTIIYAKDLEQSLNVLTINAQLNNYTPQKIQFFAKVFERASKLQLLLNEEDKTSDPVIELPIGSILNITVKFTDNVTGLHITNATIQLESDSLLLFSTEYPGLEQYSLVINTTILKIGVNLFKLVAYRPNYETQNYNLRITINKISTVISTVSGEPQIITGPGQNINLRIVLDDTDFGGTIKGAIVTYRWAYGQGNLTDSDNDGIYEAVIDGAPIGTYLITITASGYENYDFESYEITLSVTEIAGPEGLTWIVYVLIGVIVGVIVGFTAYQTRFKYPPMVRKIRKLRKKIRKGKKTKPISSLKRIEIIESNLKEQTSIIEFEKEIDNDQIYKINKE